MEYINIEGSVKLNAGKDLTNIINKVKNIEFEDDGFMNADVKSSWLTISAEGLVRGEMANQIMCLLKSIKKSIAPNSSIYINRDRWDMQIILYCQHQCLEIKELALAS